VYADYINLMSKNILYCTVRKEKTKWVVKWLVGREVITDKTK
jgi:hypothetical protein